MSRSEDPAALQTALRHAGALCESPTVSDTPNAAAAEYVRGVVGNLGKVEVTTYEDPRGVTKTNLVAAFGPAADASSGGPSGHGLALAAHTDVVPAVDWHDATPGPFVPTVVGDRLYARGACDMKGPLAAMLAAIERTDLSTLTGPLYLVATADEEVGFVGARQLMQTDGLYRRLVEDRVPMLVGEPTELAVVHAHKGSCLITATARGVAGHSSGTAGRNANWAMIPFLAEMAEIRTETERDARWHDDRFAPPTLGLNVTVNDGNRAINVTSDRSVCHIYVRPMPTVPVGPLVDRLTDAAGRHGLEISVERAGEAVYVEPDSPFVTLVGEVAGTAPPRTVSYGTDAAAFVADIPEVVVCGPGSIEQAHTRDEFITLGQLSAGVAFFGRLIDRCCRQ